MSAMATSGQVKFKLDDVPTILKLKKIKNSDGLNAIQTIAAGDYETVGMYLLKDDNGKKVKLLIKGDNEGAESHTRTILESWLDNGDLPRTYRYLIECLEEAEMGAFAGHVKKMSEEATAPPTASSTTASSTSSAAPATTVQSPAPQTLLKIDSLVNVLEALTDLNDWRSLGLKLGIRNPTLDRIEDEVKKSDRKREMLSLWFKWADNVTKPQFGKPSWDRLITAVGQVDLQLAEEIKEAAPWNN